MLSAVELRQQTPSTAGCEDHTAFHDILVCPILDVLCMLLLAIRVEDIHGPYEMKPVQAFFSVELKFVHATVVSPSVAVVVKVHDPGFRSVANKSNQAWPR